MAKKNNIFEKKEKSDYDKLMDIFEYVIKNHSVRLNVPTIKKIYEIDPKFDFDRFNIDAKSVLNKVPIEILYNPYPDSRGWSNSGKNKPNEKIPTTLMNTSNCRSISIHNVLSYKIVDSDKSLTDINNFIKNIDNVTSFVCADYDWKTKSQIGEKEYQVKYLKSKTKTLRFVLHSCTKKVHNLTSIQNQHRGIQDYYIDGNPVKKEVWLKHSREYKLKRVVNE